VEPAATQISRNGTTTRLEPKVMAVLEYLAHRPGQPVTREELEAAVWAGTIVSYDALTGAIQKLRKAFHDDPRRSRIIETLSKKGYRLVAPVERLPEPAGAAAGVSSAVTAAHRRTGFRKPAGLLLLCLALVAGGVACWPAVRVPAPAVNGVMAATNSVAVLPFDNLSRDPEQDYFADGMTDELITGLARHPVLLVIARESAFMYRDRTLDMATIARRLNVRYLLTGSV
jgi:DNA-binding winged helix-turn-helix (wHTH) protein